jgi:hypothetical protein
LYRNQIIYARRLWISSWKFITGRLDKSSVGKAGDDDDKKAQSMRLMLPPPPLAAWSWVF